ncbi:MAG: hypothetical protein ACOC93_02265, partial [Planctomycetota bacterium]
TDYHPIAIEKFGGPVSGEKQIQATLDVFAACNRKAREIKPDLRIVSFLYAELPDEIIRPWAGTEGFDDIGPDGKVARGEDLETPKVLIDNMPRFIAAAKEHGKRSFCLIETQSFDVRHAEITLKRLPEFLTQPVEHIAVYYQPLVQEPAAQITEQIGPILRDWRRQG